MYEERAYEKDDGELVLVEISRNWFAICKQTNDVYYFGEDSRDCDADLYGFDENDECCDEDRRMWKGSHRLVHGKQEKMVPGPAS